MCRSQTLCASVIVQIQVCHPKSLEPKAGSNEFFGIRVLPLAGSMESTPINSYLIVPTDLF
jgi:hypothetical protein